VTKRTLLLVFAIGSASAEVHPLTLRQAVETALRENPDVVLARLDEQRALAGIRVAKDPFQPKVFAGSGARGSRSSIEGSAPSIIQARTDMSLFESPEEL
jgi:outer membrane protein